MIITAVPSSNNSKLGGWDVRNSGNVSVSGIAVANQYAKWTSPYTIQGVAPSQVQQDIQAYPITGGVLTGNVTIQKSNPILTLWKAASGEQAAIEGKRSGGAGSMRWRLLLGDETNEPGSGNIGSDFRLDNYNDGGTFVGSPFSIGRATGNALFGANVQITGQLTANGTILVSKISPQIIVNKTASGQAAQIQGKTAANLRWVMNLGDNVAETGSNAGSNFTLDAYDDATNTFLSSPLTIARATGAVTINGNLTVNGTIIGKREVLTANRSYYVRTDGSDSNNGLANTSGGAFLTIQKAIDVTCGLDTGIYNVGINVADGTYAVTGTALTLKTITGAGGVSITGNTTTPTNCVIAATSGFCVYAPGVRGTWTVNGFHLKALTAGFDNVLATQMSLLNLSNLRFEGLNAHVHATFGAVIVVQGSNYSVAGNFNIHLFCDSHSTIQEVGCTYTAIGTPAIGQAWAWCTQGALIITNANTYTACVCTGPRYFVSGVSYVNTGTAGNATYFPGSTAGSVATGGIYD
jgi:hypothetical protein